MDWAEWLWIWDIRWDMNCFLPLTRNWTGSDVDLLLRQFRRVASSIIGGAFIHIFVFCIIHFFWNRLFLQSVNTNIWIMPPPPNYRAGYAPAPIIQILSIGHAKISFAILWTTARICLVKNLKFVSWIISKRFPRQISLDRVCGANHIRALYIIIYNART